MLYGRPTKHIRHADETSYTIEPQRFSLHTFWRYDAAATSRTDGQDIQDDKTCPLGSKITKHKVDILVTPETIEPQQLYIGRVKLSFHDIYASPVCGGRFDQASYGDTATENFVADTNPIALNIYPNVESGTLEVNGAGSAANVEIGGSSSGFGITEWLLDDNIKHFVNVKKVTVFDQRPLMGERWQRIPSKVRRINEGTFYGLWMFNDSPRGATPADTQLTVNLKEYWEEMAI